MWWTSWVLAHEASIADMDHQRIPASFCSTLVSPYSRLKTKHASKNTFTQSLVQGRLTGGQSGIKERVISIMKGLWRSWVHFSTLICCDLHKYLNYSMWPLNQEMPEWMLCCYLRMFHCFLLFLFECNEAPSWKPSVRNYFGEGYEDVLSKHAWERSR